MTKCLFAESILIQQITAKTFADLFSCFPNILKWWCFKMKFYSERETEASKECKQNIILNLRYPLFFSSNF